MDKPEGLAGEPIFMVEDMPIGKYGDQKLPARVNIRLERMDEPRQTVDHETITDWLDFGITSSIMNHSNIQVLILRPKLVPLVSLEEPFTAARLSTLAALAEFHHNSLYDYCVHQTPPQGPRGRRPYPCEKTGFKYGDAWLVRPLPEDFLSRLRGVFEGCDPNHIYDSGETT